MICVFICVICVDGCYMYVGGVCGVYVMFMWCVAYVCVCDMCI